jgi:hypothetical protein
VSVDRTVRRRRPACNDVAFPVRSLFRGERFEGAEHPEVSAGDHAGDYRSRLDANYNGGQLDQNLSTPSKIIASSVDPSASPLSLPRASIERLVPRITTFDSQLPSWS